MNHLKLGNGTGVIELVDWCIRVTRYQQRTRVRRLRALIDQVSYPIVGERERINAWAQISVCAESLYHPKRWCEELHLVALRNLVHILCQISTKQTHPHFRDVDEERVFDQYRAAWEALLLHLAHAAERPRHFDNVKRELEAKAELFDEKTVEWIGDILRERRAHLNETPFRRRRVAVGGVAAA